MPNPVPLATKEEEDRRAWVTAHHEVVRLVKDCFGDRFSNNEIFDRLKISRRTGYRALGNDDRIGKAPGRKPKITDATIREMIDYIEAGGCTDVGNVWKHLAERFAPDCNPKTVQDAVKKSGFKNYRDTVKLEPLLAVHISDGPTEAHIPLHTQHPHDVNNHHHHHHHHHQISTADGVGGGGGEVVSVVDEVDETQLQQLQHASGGGGGGGGDGGSNGKDDTISRQHQHVQNDGGLHHVEHPGSSSHHLHGGGRRHLQHQHSDHNQQQDPNPHHHHQNSVHHAHHEDDSNIDPSFHQPPVGISEALRSAIEASSDNLLRYTLSDICQRFPEAAQLASSYLIYVPSQPAPGAAAPPPPLATQLPPDIGDPSNPQIHPSLQMHNVVAAADTTGLDVGVVGLAVPGKRSRIAVCRRCGHQYDRAENTMENRSCLYHKGSPQRISPDTTGTIVQNPEAFIWSCCGGNGIVRGCCRAMHTTKKKRSYGKKRDATTAGLDDSTLGVDAGADGVDINGGDENGIDESGLGLDPSSVDVDVDVDMDESTMLSVAAAVQMQNHHQHHHRHHQHQQLENNSHVDHDLNVDASLQDLQLPAAAVQQMQSHAQNHQHHQQQHPHHSHYQHLQNHHHERQHHQAGRAAVAGPSSSSSDNPAVAAAIAAAAAAAAAVGSVAGVDGGPTTTPAKAEAAAAAEENSNHHHLNNNHNEHNDEDVVVHTVTAGDDDDSVGVIGLSSVDVADIINEDGDVNGDVNGYGDGHIGPDADAKNDATHVHNHNNHNNNNEEDDDDVDVNVDDLNNDDINDDDDDDDGDDDDDLVNNNNDDDVDDF